MWEKDDIPRNRKVYREIIPSKTALAAKQYKLMAVESPGSRFDDDLKLVGWLPEDGLITPVIVRVGSTVRYRKHPTRWRTARGGAKGGQQEEARIGQVRKEGSDTGGEGGA
eukprot:g47747.t1